MITDAFAAALQSPMTRRGFIKRTAATTLVAVFALNAFRAEAAASEEGSSSEKKQYTIQVTGFGLPMIEIAPSEGDHPKEVVPRNNEGGPIGYGGDTEAEWIQKSGWENLTEPQIHDGEEYEMWSAVEVILKWRTTSSFTEVKLPANKEGLDWGYYSTSHNFNWKMRMEIYFVRLARDPDTNEVWELSRTLWKYENFAHSGSVSVDPDTGKITLNPVPPCPLAVVSSGWAKQGLVYYTVEMRKTSSSWGMYIHIAKPPDNEPPAPENVGPCVLGDTDFYTWSVVPYTPK